MIAPLSLRNFLVLGVLGAFAAVPAGAQPGSSDPLWAGKADTGRAFTLERTLEMPPGEVYKLWTTRDGVRTFFAPEIHLDLQLGGRYEILFDPVRDPAGARAGTHGGRILRLVPDREVVFDWTFPPFGPALDTQPYPTWVEIHIEPVEGAPGKTHLSLIHRGWPEGAAWDKALASFRDSHWPWVLNNLENYSHDRQPVQWPTDKQQPAKDGAGNPTGRP